MAARHISSVRPSKKLSNQFGFTCCSPEIHHSHQLCEGRENGELSDGGQRQILRVLYRDPWTETTRAGPRPFTSRSMIPNGRGVSRRNRRKLARLSEIVPCASSTLGR